MVEVYIVVDKVVDMMVEASLVPRPSHAPTRKRVWNLSQDFLSLLNQHDDVYYVI